MCGIFGFFLKPDSDFPDREIAGSLRHLALSSESRGKDSSGIAFRNSNEGELQVIKGDIPISQLLKSKQYRKLLARNQVTYQRGNAFAAFGHARLVTNGSQLKEVNNQPVVKSGAVIIHNGIIVNADELWHRHQDLNREYLIDTEIIPALLSKALTQEPDLSNSCHYAFSQLIGTYSVAVLFENLDQLVLATNNASLYYLTDDNNYLLFTSEEYPLRILSKSRFGYRFGKANDIRQLSANNALVVNLNTIKIDRLQISQHAGKVPVVFSSLPCKISKSIINNGDVKQEVVIDPSIYIHRASEKHLFNLLEYNIDAIRKLRRCTRCLLPSTFPFIEFDDAGVCNYCLNYTPAKQTRSLSELKELTGPYQSRDGRADCIVPFSGGRDSTYSLHIIKRELGLNPIAFTYDWGMVTDLARRNIARVCGKLGVENIIVSADIHWKRENIHKNVHAWLKKPSLGMVPLFMAGDKYFFYYTNQVKRQTGIRLNIWGINPLENTEFKTGFANLPPNFHKKRIYSLTFQNQLKLAGYVAANLLKSPGYLNQSLLDTAGSFVVRYIAPKRDYYHLFDYYKWDEDEITNLIKDEYQWETAIDTNSTWRIGDGTASFYNYIYYTVAGFSENDTFRSNQIREGMLDRETALRLAENDNHPRYETLRWYLEIIGIDFETAIKRINQIPKLYASCLQ